MSLTPAERAALDAVARFGSVKAAAHGLGKSPYTIEVQLRAARRKLGAGSSLQAYAYLKNGNIGMEPA